MKRLFTIQPLVAFALLFVFAFAITPKRYLHNLIVNHKDSYVKHTDGKTEVSKNAIYCQCDNLVATSPFTGAVEKAAIKLPVVFVLHHEKIFSSRPSTPLIYFSLRGPPASIIL